MGFGCISAPLSQTQSLNYSQIIAGGCLTPKSHTYWSECRLAEYWFEWLCAVYQNEMRSIWKCTPVQGSINISLNSKFPWNLIISNYDLHIIYINLKSLTPTWCSNTSVVKLAPADLRDSKMSIVCTFDNLLIIVELLLVTSNQRFTHLP